MCSKWIWNKIINHCQLGGETFLIWVPLENRNCLKSKHGWLKETAHHVLEYDKLTGVYDEVGRLTSSISFMGFY